MIIDYRRALRLLRCDFIHL